MDSTKNKIIHLEKRIKHAKSVLPYAERNYAQEHKKILKMESELYQLKEL